MVAWRLLAQASRPLTVEVNVQVRKDGGIGAGEGCDSWRCMDCTSLTTDALFLRVGLQQARLQRSSTTKAHTHPTLMVNYCPHTPHTHTLQAQPPWAGGNDPEPAGTQPEAGKTKRIWTKQNGIQKRTGLRSTAWFVLERRRCMTLLPPEWRRWVGGRAWCLMAEEGIGGWMV